VLYLVDWGGSGLGDGATHSWRVVDPVTKTDLGQFLHLEVLAPCRLLNLPDVFMEHSPLKGWMKVEGILTVNGTTAVIMRESNDG